MRVSYLEALGLRRVKFRILEFSGVGQGFWGTELSSGPGGLG